MNARRSRQLPWQPSNWVSSLQTNMLYQDFSNQVVPYRQTSATYILSVKGVARRQIDEGLSLDYQSRGPDDFVRDVSIALLTNHEVWLEVTFDMDNSGGPPFAVFPVYGVKRTTTGKLIQETPSQHEFTIHTGDGDEYELEIELDEEQMIPAILPYTYHSELLTQVVNGLLDISNYGTPPAWVMDNLTNNRREAPYYDATEAIRTEKLRVVQAALPIGWTAREALQGPTRVVGDYYHYWRELRFLHFRASIREQAEQALYRVLTLASEKCNFEVSIKAQGIYTPGEVTEFINKFKSGDLSFADVSDITLEKPSSNNSVQRLIV